jgi:hypothetical protein
MREIRLTVTRLLSLEGEELLILPEHLSSHTVLTVARSLFCFVDYCMSIRPLSFSHCIVCPSSMSLSFQSYLDIFLTIMSSYGSLYMAINIRYTSNTDNDLKKLWRFRTQNDMLKKERNLILRLRHFVYQLFTTIRQITSLKNIYSK